MRVTHGADPLGRRSSSYSAVSEAIAPARVRSSLRPASIESAIPHKYQVAFDVLP
jgi:hypothetical protein